jgi:hypothetical protein
VFTGLAVGGTYTITLGWDTTESSLHALDYLTSYDYTWNGGSGSGVSVDGRALDGTGLSPNTPFTTLQIPVDPNINNAAFPATNFMINGRTPVGSPTNPPNQFFTMFGADLTAASGYQLYPMTGNTAQTLSITFTATSPTAVLVWGGHIASELDWGPGTGAGTISGSPFHMRQVTFSGPGASNPGNQELSLLSSSVIFPTTIVVNKQVVDAAGNPIPAPAVSGQTFNFTNTPNVFFVAGEAANIVNQFSLDGSNTFLVPPYVLPGSAPGNATVLMTRNFTVNQITELVPAGWTLTGVSIHSLLSGTSSQTGPTASFSSVRGDTLWVTFSDRFEGASSTATVIRDAATGSPLTGNPAIGAPGDSVFDTAVVTFSPAPSPSTPTPTGDVTYTFTGSELAGLTPPAGWVVVNPTTWTNTAPLTVNPDGTVTVANSPATPPLPPGSGYVFTASYSGDGNFAGSTSEVEPLTINKGSSSLVTTIMAAAGGPPVGTLGGSVFDTATLTVSPEGILPTGTVTYTFTGTNGTSLAGLTPPAGWVVISPTTWQETVTLVNGTVPNSAATPALRAGSYQFTAVYSGDDKYAASPPSAPEPLTITQGSSSTATVILAAGGGPPTMTLGESVFDTATVTGSPVAFPPSGTVTYTFTGAALAGLTVPAGWDQAGQTGLTAWTETVTLVNGTVPDSALTPALPAGSYQFTASYSGDGNYAASPPQRRRAPDHPPGQLQHGDRDHGRRRRPAHHDAGRVGLRHGHGHRQRGGRHADGHGDLHLYRAGAGRPDPPGGLDGGQPHHLGGDGDAGQRPGPRLRLDAAAAAGSFQFTADYSGDGNYAASASVAEPLAIFPAPAVPVTTIEVAAGGPLTNGQAPLGTSVFDTTTFTGIVPSFPPTGVVTYFFTGAALDGLPVAAGWTVVDATTWEETVTLTGGAAPASAPTGPLPAGSYQFTAFYSGDGNYPGSLSAAEPLAISRGTSGTATVIRAAAGSPPLGTLGGSVFDTATVTGSPAAFPPTGTVTYEFFANGTLVSSEPVTLVNGAVPDSAVHGPLAAGSYSFVAVYSGDDNYARSTRAAPARRPRSWPPAAARPSARWASRCSTRPR